MREQLAGFIRDFFNNRGVLEFVELSDGTRFTICFWEGPKVEVDGFLKGSTNPCVSGLLENATDEAIYALSDELITKMEDFK